MPHAYALALGGALFKKKVKENGHDGDSKSREKAIRDKVVDDLRGREDALRERESAIAAREEEHGKKSAELALKLQELAVRETALKGKNGEGGAPTKAAAHHELPPDSDKVEEQEKLVLALEHRLAGARSRHEELRRASGSKGRLAETIAAYRSSGYLVARLEKLQGLSAAELEKALGRFEKDAAALGPLATRCDALDRAVAKESEALRARCNDPDAIAEIERGIKELEARLEARRADLKKRVDRWKSEGYSVARFGKLADAGLGALEEAAAKFEEDIEVLRMFTEKLHALDDSARKDSARLAPMLKDPDNIPVLEKEFLELEKQAGARVQQFLELFEKWRSEGFRVEPLEKALSADLPTMRAAFLKFDENVSRLRALSERASKLDVSFPTEVAGLDRGLHDPEQLHQMELAVKELEDRAGKQKTAPVRRALAPPPKVVAAGKAAPAQREKAEEKAPPLPEPPKPPALEPVLPAPAGPAKAAAEPAPPAGGPEAEVAAEMAAAEALINELQDKKIDPSAAANLLKLGRSFNRSKNYAKALQYAKKAKDIAAAMRK